MKYPQQITVFGGSGFLGRHIIRLLAQTGAQIIVPTRDTEKAMILKPMGNVGQIVIMRASSRSDNDVRAAIGKSDAVINLLGILFEKGKNSFQCIHVETAARIARIAREHGVTKLVQISAMGSSATSPSAYGRSKFAGEEAVRTFFPEATILRPSIVFGPEDNFFNMFSRMANILPALPLIGGGHTKFQPVFVEDVAKAVLASLSNEKAAGQSYDIGGPTIYTFRQLLEMLLKQRGIRRCLLPLPWPLAMAQATLMELLPTPPLTRDQVRSLRIDNVIDAGTKNLKSLGITPTPLELILPTYIA